jgi:uncharacterized protein involved in response to NO
LSGTGFALWRLGFRPFYLAASVFASLAIVLWLLQYFALPASGYGIVATWHAHEMLFGFTIAVVTGFLLTAVPNWTSRPTPTGARLAALVALWLAGRVLMLSRYPFAAAIVNAAFPLAVAAAIAVPLIRSGNRRNYFLVGLLVALAAATLGVHLAHLGIVPWPARLGLQAGLDIVLFVMAVIAGRVVPMFTNNAIPGTGASRARWLERAALGSILALLAADLADAAWIAGGIALAAAIAHLLRLALWRPWRTLRTPLVWILHAGYAWIVVHLALRAAAAFGDVAPSLATHALTIGAIGGLTIGMMTRTARGHTGRPLVADGSEVAAYALVMLAALARVLGGLAWPAQYTASVAVAGVAWSAAYAIYAVRYWPVLTRPRVDGRPG